MTDTSTDRDQTTPPPPPSARVDELLDEVARLRIAGAAKDRVRCRIGVGLMALAAGLVVVAYVKSSTNDSVLVQNDAQVLAIGALVVALIGAAVFLRYSIGEFLRFWLARALVGSPEDRTG